MVKLHLFLSSSGQGQLPVALLRLFSLSGDNQHRGVVHHSDIFPEGCMAEILDARNQVVVYDFIVETEAGFFHGS